MAEEKIKSNGKRERWRVNDALGRAKARWTPWRFVLIPVGFALMAGTALFVNYFNGQIYSLLAPNKASFCGPNRISELVLLLNDILLSIPVGLLLANLCLWLIPPIRRRLNAAEARVGRTFVQSNSELFRFMLFTFLILLPVHAVAIASRVCISASQVYYQKYLFSEMRTYARSEIKAIRKTCSISSRGGSDIEFYLVMKDDSAIYLPVDEASLQRDFPLLDGIPVDGSQCFPKVSRTRNQASTTRQS